MEDLRSNKNDDEREDLTIDKSYDLKFNNIDSAKKIQDKYIELFDNHARAERELYRIDIVEMQIKNLTREKNNLRASIPKNQINLKNLEAEFFELLKNELVKNLTKPQIKKIENEDFEQLVRNSLVDIVPDFLGKKIILENVDIRLINILRGK